MHGDANDVVEGRTEVLAYTVAMVLEPVAPPVATSSAAGAVPSS